MRRINLLLTLCLVFSAGVFAQNSSRDQYENSVAGLRDQVKDLARDFAAADDPGKTRLLQALEFPDAPAWFRKIFGDSIGAVLAQDYAQHAGRRAATLRRALGIIGPKPGVKADLFDDRCSEFADGDKYPVLGMRRSPTDLLYQVRMNYQNWDSVLWFFVYVDGRFRYTGTFNFKDDDLHAALINAFRAQHGIEATPAAGFDAPSVIQREPAKYPKEASRRFVEGQMELWVVIGRDGSVGDILPLNGHCWFAKAVEESVRKWKFRPARENGQPVDSITAIHFDFGFRARQF